MRALRVFLLSCALSLVAVGSSAQQPVPGSECPASLGYFLVRGEVQEGDSPPQSIYYLERSSSGRSRSEGHYFSFSFDPVASVFQATVYTSAGGRLFTSTGREPFRC